ncbi:hypothetical protein [Tepidimonas charontis]|uniref:Transposase n=1 Tax=Tepidimonas charontis TaxID=2267262 RepID=A0A554XCA4_9BURK|nr:hypothetical protein [Tepidimonas charontis]TSE33458.1 hypothetical protein Tchar_01714 [Tepidimonas charontis]
MKTISVRIPLSVTAEQAVRLQALQRTFAQACNLLAPLVREHRCWNRVALHHLGYRLVRQQLPALGSQMACNAIYSVCRAARLVFQHPRSPFHIQRLGDKPLPLLRFADDCPVYFDRHTLCVRQGRVSMYTLDGRLRFDLALRPQDEEAFHTMRLIEIVLVARAAHDFELIFTLQSDSQSTVEGGDVTTLGASAAHGAGNFPAYLMVEPTA